MPRLVPMKTGEGDRLLHFDAVRFAYVMVVIECGVTLLPIRFVLLPSRFGYGVEICALIKNDSQPLWVTWRAGAGNEMSRTLCTFAS